MRTIRIGRFPYPQTNPFFEHPFGNTNFSPFRGLNDEIGPLGTKDSYLLLVMRMKSIINFRKLNFMGILYPSCPG